MRTHRRREEEAVGLLARPRDRQCRGSFLMTAERRLISREDVWTLLAVAYAGWDGRGAAPGTVLGLSRVIGHAAMGDERAVRGSLARLRGAGLVEASGGLHRATAQVAAFLRTRTERRGVWHDYRDLVHYLGFR